MSAFDDLEKLGEDVLEQAAALECCRRNIRSILRNTNRLKEAERIQLSRAAEGAHAGTLQCLRVYEGVLETTDLLKKYHTEQAEIAAAEALSDEADEV